MFSQMMPRMMMANMMNNPMAAMGAMMQRGGFGGSGRGRGSFRGGGRGGRGGRGAPRLT